VTWLHGLRCSGCPAVFDGKATGLPALREQAGAAGWEWDGERDYCPACVARIARLGVTIVCDACGGAQPGEPGLSVAQVRAALEREGWQCDQDANTDRCPHCAGHRPRGVRRGIEPSPAWQEIAGQPISPTRDVTALAADGKPVL
jgi:hypothetical protein